jgi:hypothetical protein
MTGDADSNRPQREFQEGIAHISSALLDAAKSAGISAGAGDIRLEPEWHRGDPIPSAMRIVLKPTGAPAMIVNLSREQIEDCWNGLDRPEVRQIMREVTDRYKRMQGK